MQFHTTRLSDISCQRLLKHDSFLQDFTMDSLLNTQFGIPVNTLLFSWTKQNVNIAEQGVHK